MSWIGILLVIGVGLLILLGMKISEHLEVINGQLGSLSTRLQDLHAWMESAENHLSSIEGHSKRQAQPLYEKDDRERRESEENPFYHVQRDGI